MSESVYTEKYVLFLDILGFEAYTTSDEKSEEFAKKVLPAFDKLVNVLPLIINKLLHNKEHNTHISQFSDTFIISSSNHNAITQAVNVLQPTLLNYQLLSRGAVTYGKVFHNGSQFIGPAITRACNLEKSEAIYPRVILDTESFPDDFDLKASIGLDYVRQDFDGWHYFISPNFALRPPHFRLPPNFKEQQLCDFNQMHEKVKQGENYWKLKSKYIWFEKTYFGN
jgi:hypothetical protein